jgi:hypothetical protein
LHWVGSAKRDFLSFPLSVKDDIGNALGIAQFGGTAPTAKPWKGLGPVCGRLLSRTTETPIGTAGAPHEAMVEKREGPENEEIPGERQTPQHTKDVLHQNRRERHVSRSPRKIEHGRCDGKTYRGEIKVEQ